MGFATTIILSVIWTSVVQCIIEGRKDSNTCCDKLKNSTFPDDCFETFLWAGENEKYAYTPNFPNQFPIQKKCVWGIYARPGKRVRLEFRDFYLIGPGDDGICYSQGVLIKSPLSSLSVGPHCGNAGLPTVVSDGNYLVVELLSNIPMTTENYRGFKMSFVETDETPSPQLRPPNWGNNDVITVDPEILAKKFPAFTRKATRKVTKTTRIPSRFRPTVRPLSLLPPLITRFNFETSLSGIAGETGKKSISPTGKTLLLEEIVGIAVGGVVFIGIIVVIALKLRKRKQPETEVSRDKGDGTDKATHVKIEMEMENVNDTSPQNPNFLPGYYVYYFHQSHQAKTDNRRQKAPISDPNMKDPKHSSNKKRRKHNRAKAISSSADDCKLRQNDKKKTPKSRATRRKIRVSKTADGSVRSKGVAHGAAHKTEPKKNSGRRENKGDRRLARPSRKAKRKTEVENSENVITKNRTAQRKSHRARKRTGVDPSS